jgi:hypothetical protein
LPGANIPTTQTGGSGTFNWGKAFGLTDIEAARAAEMGKECCWNRCTKSY